MQTNGAMEHRFSLACGCGAVVVAKNSAAVVLQTRICAECLERAYKLLQESASKNDFQLDWIDQVMQGQPMLLDVKPRSE